MGTYGLSSLIKNGMSLISNRTPISKSDSVYMICLISSRALITVKIVVESKININSDQMSNHPRRSTDNPIVTVRFISMELQRDNISIQITTTARTIAYGMTR